MSSVLKDSVRVNDLIEANKDECPITSSIVHSFFNLVLEKVSSTSSARAILNDHVDGGNTNSGSPLTVEDVKAKILEGLQEPHANLKTREAEELIHKQAAIIQDALNSAVDVAKNFSSYDDTATALFSNMENLNDMILPITNLYTKPLPDNSLTKARSSTDIMSPVSEGTPRPIK